MGIPPTPQQFVSLSKQKTCKRGSLESHENKGDSEGQKGQNREQKAEMKKQKAGSRRQKVPKICYTERPDEALGGSK